MASINYAKSRKTISRDTVSPEADGNLSLPEEEERILGLGYDVGSGHGEEVGVHRRLGRRSRFALGHRSKLESEGKEPRRSFCRSWCEMWFLLARSKVTCVGLSLLLLGFGVLLILLTVFGGLMQCPTLNGAVIFCLLMSVLSLSLGFLCCCYHWVKDDDDLPFAIFCVAYCLLLLFMFVTVAGTVVVFTRIYPIGSDQPPPGIPLPHQGGTSSPTVDVEFPHQNGTSGLAHQNGTINLTHQNGTGSLTIGVKECEMVELPLGVLVLCYILSLGFVIMAYVACILALGATSDIPPL